MRRLLDVACSLVALVLLAPLVATIAVAILCDDGKPVLYKQERVGRGFRKFRLYKFRSMLPGADRAGLLTAPKDARLTRCGVFLRRTKLDELPQLLNVIKGDMQFVGPRPEVPKYVDLFHAQYQELLRERPGITDAATLVFRHEERFLRVNNLEEHYVSQILPRKLELSLRYQRQRNFFSDVMVLLRTVFGVVIDLPQVESSVPRPASIQGPPE